MSSTAEPRGLHEFFAQAVVRWPDAVAVDVPPAASRPGRETLTYAELKHESELLAGVVNLAVGRGAVAAIMLGRTTPRLYVAQLAVLTAAAAYVCVDPAFPDDQVTHILSDSRARALLTDAAGAERAAGIGYPGPIIRVDLPLTTPALPLPKPPGPDDVAYIIYTSGTHRPAQGRDDRAPGRREPGRRRRAGIRPRPRRPGGTGVFAGLRLLGRGDLDGAGHRRHRGRRWTTRPRGWARTWCPGCATSASRCSARRRPCCVPPAARIRARNCRTCGCSTSAARPLPRRRRRAVGARPPHGQRLRPDGVHGHVHARRTSCPASPSPSANPCRACGPGSSTTGWNPLSRARQGELCMGGAGLALGYLNQPELTTREVRRPSANSAGSTARATSCTPSRTAPSSTTGESTRR